MTPEAIAVAVIPTVAAALLYAYLLIGSRKAHEARRHIHPAE